MIFLSFPHHSQMLYSGSDFDRTNIPLYHFKLLAAFPADWSRCVLTDDLQDFFRSFQRTLGLGNVCARGQ